MLKISWEQKTFTEKVLLTLGLASFVTSIGLQLVIWATQAWPAINWADMLNRVAVVIFLVLVLLRERKAK